MATNYLSASLLSDTYGSMLNEDDRERERQLLSAFESAQVSVSEITSENLLRNGGGLLLSYSDIENNSTEEYWQLVRVPNKKPKIILSYLESVLKEKRLFNEFQPTTPPPEPSTLSNLEDILKENIDILHAMKDALMKYETIDAKQIDDLMARQPVREPRDAHDRLDDKPTKTVAPQEKPVDESQKPDDSSKKDETNLDDKAE